MHVEAASEVQGRKQQDSDVDAVESGDKLAALDDEAFEQHIEDTWQAFRALGCPKFVCAPMVDGSELPFRMLVRRYQVQLAYSPMLHAASFNFARNYPEIHFTTCPEDRPLVVQFAANDPDVLIQAAKQVQGVCDAVDINLGCPQRIARRGHYGAFLQDEWPLVSRLVHTAHHLLSVPVWCKIRIFNDVERTVAYARMIERAGCSLLAVHGRTREQKGHNTGLANWDTIAAVKAALRIPVYANGNVRSRYDVEECLRQTGCDGVMSAEPLLRNPRLFSGEVDPPPFQLAREYLAELRQYPVLPGMARMHLFKILEERLGGDPMLCGKLATANGLSEFEQAIMEIEHSLNQRGTVSPAPLMSDQPAAPTAESNDLLTDSIFISSS